MMKRVVQVLGAHAARITTHWHQACVLECGHRPTLRLQRVPSVGELVACGPCARLASLAAAVAAEPADSDGLDFSIDALRNR